MYNFQHLLKQSNQTMRQGLRLLVLLLVAQATNLPLMSQFGSNVQYFSQVILNQGSITSFTLHNPSSTSAITVDVQLYLPNGDPLASEQVELAPGGTETVSFGESGGVLTRGSAELTSNGEFIANEFFQVFVGELGPRVGVLPNIATHQIRFLGFVNDQFKSGIAVFNPSKTDSTEITLTLKDKEGFYPDFTDTSKKADNGPGGVSWGNDESTQRSSNEKRWRWRTIRV